MIKQKVISNTLSPPSQRINPMLASGGGISNESL
jgi:hypothetical protein